MWGGGDHCVTVSTEWRVGWRVPGLQAPAVCPVGHAPSSSKMMEDHSSLKGPTSPDLWSLRHA